jgi:hypothetical protein
MSTTAGGRWRIAVKAPSWRRPYVTAHSSRRCDRKG